MSRMRIQLTSESTTNQETKMRALFSVILCLSMAAYIMADIELGERQQGDYVITNRTIFKPAIPWKAMTAVISVKTPSLDETITYVKISNTGDKEADFILMSGGVGMESVIVRALGKVGEGMLVRVEGAAISPSTITSPVPPITSKSTPPAETTKADTTLVSSEE